MTIAAPFRTALTASIVLGLAASAPCQRGVRTLTSIGASAVRLSPNGNWIAFKTTDNGVLALAVISTLGSATPTMLVTDQSLTAFLWAPDSTGLYYLVADQVFYTRSIGGTPRLVARIGGNNPRLFALDSKDAVLVGTRGDGQGGNAIFTLPTSGATLPKDILQSGGLFFDEIRVSPNDQRICYTAQPTGFPHAPIEIRAIDLDGQNDASLSGGGLPRTNVDVSLPRDLVWVDAATVLFTAVDVRRSTWELMRVSATANDPVPMTLPPQHFQRSTISGDRRTVAFVQNTFHGTTVPGIMPAAGGARVPLEPEEDWILAGSPSIDGGAVQVAFAGYRRSDPSGRPEVQLIDLAREIRVAPRPALGVKLTFELPLLFNEHGTLFLSTGLATNDPKQQFRLPGFDYAVAIDANVLLPLIAGTGTGAPLSFTATVPNDAALVGFLVYLQGLRIRRTNPEEGDFTRYAELQFLD